MKLLNFTIIKLTLCLTIGILIGHLFSINIKIVISISISIFLLFVILFFILKNKINNSFWFGFCAYICIISLGILNTNLRDHKQFNSHYTNEIIINDSTNNTITFRIREVVKPSNFHDKYVVNILTVDSTSTFGKLLLNINKDSTKQLLKVDDIFVARAQIKELFSPLNPHQFDYKAYLKKQQVYHQLYIKQSELLTVSNNKHTIFGYASRFREYIQTKLKQYNFKTDEYAIISALLLGQRQDISKEIYDSYSQAGVIHILAVSGLHVGIILLMLNYLLKPLEFVKKGKYLKVVIIVVLLWCFAIVAGLSASVTRAVTMFSIIAIAINYKRPTNIYNTLAISIFILLLFKPSFIFDVGFQLSYMAVLAIVLIQPLLYKLYKPKYNLDDFYWNIFTVTLAAQFGVIPLSLYYFHQFPGLFFLSNLVIIPFLGVILGLGILIIVLASSNMLPYFLADVYSFIIAKMNDFVQWVSYQEAFLFQNISFNLIQVFLSYFLIAIILSIIIYKSFKSLRLLLILIIISQVFFIYTKQMNQNQEFLIFHKSKYTMLGFKNKDSMEVYHNLNDSILNLDKTLINYKVGSFIKNIDFDTLHNIYNVNNKTLMIIDSLGVYKSISFKPEFILLHNSPKINLTRLIDSLQPKLIISDGSNYKSYQNRWQITCKAKKIPFHKTSEKGAYIYKY